MLQDAHIHLQDSPQRVEVMRLAAEHGAGRFFCNAVRSDDWQVVLDLSAADARIVPFVGVHPWMSAQLAAGWDKSLEDLCRGQACGIGEVGLDAVRKGLDFGRQVEACARQIDIAVVLRRPFAVHCVAAWRTMLDILKEKDLSATVFMVHAFSGSSAVLKELLALGAYISFRSLSDLSAEKTDIVRQVPDGRLLLESDFPYLAGKRAGEVSARDHAVHLMQLYRFAARIRGADAEQLQQKVWDNGTVFADAIAHR